MRWMRAISAHIAFVSCSLRAGAGGVGVVTFGGEGVPVSAAAAGQNGVCRAPWDGNSGACGVRMVTFGGEGGAPVDGRESPPGPGVGVLRLTGLVLGLLTLAG